MPARVQEHYRQKQYHPAFELATRWVRENPESAAAHYWRGLASGRLAEASSFLSRFRYVRILEEEMQKVLELDPAYSEGGAYRVLGRLYFKLPRLLGGDVKKSRRLLEKSAEIAPQNALTHEYLYETYLRLGQEESARRELQKTKQMQRQSQNSIDTAPGGP
ncbi:MAG: hypothetical protein HY402_04190 [Elusimicrobia bacterium]|nr:hypothetical protein [Elusimicrobiota bacterium]